MSALARTKNNSGWELQDNFVLVEIIQKDRKKIILSKDKEQDPVIIDRLEVKAVGPNVKMNIKVGDSVKISALTLNDRSKFIMEFGREYLLLREFDIFAIIRDMEEDESFVDLTDERYALPKTPAKTAANSSYLNEIKPEQWRDKDPKRLN